MLGHARVPLKPADTAAALGSISTTRPPRPPTAMGQGASLHPGQPPHSPFEATLHPSTVAAPVVRTCAPNRSYRYYGCEPGFFTPHPEADCRRCPEFRDQSSYQPKDTANQLDYTPRESASERQATATTGHANYGIPLTAAGAPRARFSRCATRRSVCYATTARTRLGRAPTQSVSL